MFVMVDILRYKKQKNGDRGTIVFTAPLNSQNPFPEHKKNAYSYAYYVVVFCLFVLFFFFCLCFCFLFIYFLSLLCQVLAAVSFSI